MLYVTVCSIKNNPKTLGFQLKFQFHFSKGNGLAPPTIRNKMNPYITKLFLSPPAGQMYLGTELDFEAQQMHVVTVQAEDYDQDVDRTNRKRKTQNIFIRVEVRDRPSGWGSC